MLCFMLCLMFWYFVPFCVSSLLSCVLLPLCSPLCLFPFLLACLSPSVCQYCFLHAFSSLSFPHYLTCPPASSLPTCSLFLHQRVCVFKPWVSHVPFVSSLSVLCVMFYVLNKACLLFPPTMPPYFCIWVHLLVFPFNTVIGKMHVH